MSFALLPIDQLVIIAMLIFARVGACLMLMPGISSARIPMNFRLFLAIAFSLIMVPLSGSNFTTIAQNPTLATLVSGIVSESLVGATFGVIAQAYMWALQFMANIIGMSIGYSGQPGTSVIESMPETQVANMITIGALMLFFAGDLHMIVIRGLMTSYQVVPVSLTPAPQSALIDFQDALSQTFLTTLRIASPFIIYSILVNIAVGLINKLTPTIPVYFISMPFVMFGGLLLIYCLLPEILTFFGAEYASWLNRGP